MCVCVCVCVSVWFISVLGGGFHHCCASEGGGFCVYADITLAVKVAILIIRLVLFIFCSFY